MRSPESGPNLVIIRSGFLSVPNSDISCFWGCVLRVWRWVGPPEFYDIRRYRLRSRYSSWPVRSNPCLVASFSTQGISRHRRPDRLLRDGGAIRPCLIRRIQNRIINNLYITHLLPPSEESLRNPALSTQLKSSKFEKSESVSPCWFSAGRVFGCSSWIGATKYVPGRIT